MKSSTELHLIAEDLAKVNLDLENPKHNALVNAGKGGKYSHADLVSITDTIRPAFARQGISILQSVEDNQILTRLLHKSGQWIETSFPFYCNANVAKEIGAWTTYMRKYSISLTVMIYGDKQADSDSRDEYGNDLSLSNTAPLNENLPPPRAVQQVPYSNDAPTVSLDAVIYTNKETGAEITLSQVREWQEMYNVKEGTIEHEYVSKMSKNYGVNLDSICARAMQNQSVFDKSLEEFKQKKS